MKSKGSIKKTKEAVIKVDGEYKNQMRRVKSDGKEYTYVKPRTIKTSKEEI
jgi:hypothetical protein